MHCMQQSISTVRLGDANICQMADDIFVLLLEVDNYNKIKACNVEAYVFMSHYSLHLPH